MKKNLSSIVFLLVLSIGLFFRVYQFSNVPPSASLDEATIGWNAYSLLHTGNDEYGYHLPILLRAYDDYRPALYVYTVVPFVATVGLHVISVRLPAIIFSMVGLICTFFIAKKLFEKKEGIEVALVTLFLLVISPWHIYISRLGHEVNPSLTLVLLGTVFFLYQTKKKFYLILSLIFFVLSFYTYQSEKVFVPLFVLFLFVLYRKQLLSAKKYLAIGLFLAALIALPITIASFSPGALLRLSGTSVFANNPAYDTSAKLLLKAHQQHNFVGTILYNRRVTTLTIFFQNYFSHFRLDWLYGNTGADSFKAPGVGLFYVWELPLFLLGLGVLIARRKEYLQSTILLFGWILLAILPAAITTQAPHAMRIYNVLPVPQMIEGVGFMALAFFVGKKMQHSKVVLVVGSLLCLGVVGWSVANFSYEYFVRFPKEQSESFSYAFAQALPYVFAHQHDYKQVIISSQGNAIDSYMFYLYYSRYNPKLYQQQGGTKSGGFAQTHEIGNVRFEPIKGRNLQLHTLYVVNPSDFPSGASVAKTFTYLDGKAGIQVVGVQ